MTDAELLALHRLLVSTPSISGQEGPLCDLLMCWLAERNVPVLRLGNNLVLQDGEGPVFCLNSHLDTVPASPAWMRPPHQVVVQEGRVFGLGSNDAKASVAAMLAAFMRLRGREVGLQVLLTLVCEEETSGRGTEQVLQELRRQGRLPQAVVVGEPTGLDVAVSQKGLLVLELQAKGEACHAAHAQVLKATNAIRTLAHDLVALESVDLGPADPALGPTTVEPTVVQGGSARNALPALVSCILDARINPEPGPATLVARLQRAVHGEIKVLSDRLKPHHISPVHPLVCAAQQARPQAKLFGSRTLSDLVFFADIPGIKVGPGLSERSHRVDEFVLEQEVLDGARFYEALVKTYAGMRLS